MTSEEPKVDPAKGCKSNKRASITVAVLRAVMTILGFYLVLTPLALWVAWSEQALLLIMGSGVVATIALLLCGWLTDDNRHAADSGSQRSPGIEPPTVSDEFLAELSNMGPWIYHNRLTGDRSFRTKMERLQKLLKPD